jgi:hypothetical protein
MENKRKEGDILGGTGNYERSVFEIQMVAEEMVQY